MLNIDIDIDIYIDTITYSKNEGSNTSVSLNTIEGADNKGVSFKVVSRLCRSVESF